MQSYGSFPARESEAQVNPQPSKALQCIKLGNPTEPLGRAQGPLIISHIPTDKPLHPNQLRIKVHAASLNFADALQIQGVYQEKPQIPFIPGNECSGIVIDVGRDVRGFKPGDRVCAVCQGGAFAEHVDVQAGGTIKLPASVDLEAAAGLPVAFGTAYLALVDRAKVHAGQTVLVLGAAGGVGLAAVQFAKLAGATVIAVARGKGKMEVLKSLGADAVVDLQGKKPEQLKSLVKTALSTCATATSSGIDIVFDPVGGALFNESLKCVNWGAQILVIGFASGHVPKIPANIALVKNLTVHGKSPSSTP